MHRFLARDVGHRTTIDLDEEESHHFLQVLRLGPATDVIVFDGCGQEWLARSIASSKRSVTVELVGRRPAAAEPPVAVTLAVGLLKHDQFDGVVRDATMLGASVIIPLVTAHISLSSASIKARSVDRWHRVAVASAKQCARAVVPEVRPVAAFTDVVGKSTEELLIACVEPSRDGGVSVSELPRSRNALVCVGPEGGWAREEVRLVQERHGALLSLGPRVLRAETAPTVALASLWTHWGWQAT